MTEIENKADELVEGLYNNDVEQIKRLVREHPSIVNARTVTGEPMLHLAASISAEACEVLLDAGADVDSIARDSASVFFMAKLQPEIFRSLLKRGSDPNKDWVIERVLSPDLGENASLEERLEVLELLFDNGLEVNRARSTALGPQTILDLARDSDPVLVKFLVENGAKSASELSALVLYDAYGNRVNEELSSQEEQLGESQNNGQGELVVGEEEPIDLPSLHHEDLCVHMSQGFGKIEKTITETGPSSIPVHVFVCRSPANDCLTLFTSGMCAELMPNAPKDRQNRRLAELFIKLPPDWNYEDLMDPATSWPVHCLRTIARFPFESGIWMGGPYNIFPDRNADQYVGPNNKFSSFLLLAKHKVRSSNAGELISLYQLFPLFRGEVEYEKEHGIQLLLERLRNAGVSGLVDENRPDVSSL